MDIALFSEKLRFGPHVSNEDSILWFPVMREAYGKASIEKVQEHLANRGKDVSVATIHRVIKFYWMYCQQ